MSVYACGIEALGELESETLNKVSFMSNDHSLSLSLCLSPISMSLSPCVNQMGELNKERLRDCVGCTKPGMTRIPWKRNRNSLY